MKTQIIIMSLTMLISGCGTEAVSPALPSDAPSISTPEGGQMQEDESYAHVTADTLVAEIIGHPAFEGFGQYILPVKNRSSYDASMRLDSINSLLPYHNHIKADTSVEVVNRLIDDVNAGETVFYDIYTEAQQQTDPAKADTGLFFFSGDPGAPFAIICAGGGFSYVGSIHESFPHALELSKQGYNAFALEYRLGSGAATEDLAAAISFIFKNAEALGVNTDNYSIWGGSAGARIAAYIGSYGISYFGGDDLPRPAAVIIAYTGHTDYVQDDTPTFTMVSENDPIVSVSSVDRRVENMRNVGIDVEYEKYRTAGHGFGLGIGTDAEDWLDRAVAFWEKYIVNKSNRL